MALDRERPLEHEAAAERRVSRQRFDAADPGGSVAGPRPQHLSELRGYLLEVG
jgi:hypothetical protein